MSANVATATRALPFYAPYLAIAGVVGFSSLIFDAFGQKLRVNMNARQRRAWGTANAYHLTHSAALVAIAWLAAVAGKGGDLADPVASSYATKGFWLVLAGAVGFGTSIYSLALGLSPEAAKFVGPVTPTSGLILVIGWVNVGLAGLYLK